MTYSKWDAEREAKNLQAFLKRGAMEDANFIVELQALLNKAHSRGGSDKAQSIQQEAAETQRSQWEMESWDRDLTQQVARFVAVLGETLPVPMLTRAADVAPVSSTPEWSVTIAERIRTAERTEAQEILDKVKQSSQSPAPSQRHVSRGSSDSSFVTGFVLGGLLF